MVDTTLNISQVGEVYALVKVIMSFEARCYGLNGSLFSFAGSLASVCMKSCTLKTLCIGNGMLMKSSEPHLRVCGTARL